MNLRTFLTIVAIVTLIYAVGLLLAPEFMSTTYGTTVSPGETLTNRYFGVASLGLGLVTWLARGFTGASIRPIVIGSLITCVAGLIVSLMGTLGGVMSSVGWSAVVIYLVFGLGFAYFQFMAPSK